MTSTGMSGACKECGGVNLEVEERGSKVCRDCGHVLEDSCIVSEVQFEENARGGANVIGQYVGETNRIRFEGFNNYAGFGRESREITLENAKRRIKEVGSQLRLNASCIDMAFNFYKMALSRHLTRGRKTDYVVAACLYLVCRTENIPHMLLDLSDILSVNVYTLGRTYLRLSNELCIKASAIDPCLYIHRFAELLDLDEKTHDVSMTALRLVHRMKRDWMHTGRRPSGLCGAALVVAARLHNFNRTIEDVTKVVRMSHTTIRKRLQEFEETPTAELTLEEFHHVNLESECDPPSFTQGKKKAAFLQQQLESSNIEEEVIELESIIEAQLERDVARRHRRYRKLMTFDDEDDDASVKSSGAETFKDEDFEKLLNFSSKFSFAEDGEEDGLTADEFKLLAQTTLDQVTGATKSRPTTPDEGVDVDVARLVDAELGSLLKMAPGDEEAPETKTPLGIGVGLAETIEECLNEKPKVKAEGEEEDDDLLEKATPHEEAETLDEEDCSLDLEGIDEDEIDRLILNEDEVKVKTLVWCRLNAMFLQEEKEREKQNAEDEAAGVTKKPAKTRRTRAGTKGKRGGEAATATEAIEKMLKEKKISNKINYDVLKNLESDPLILGASPTTTPSPSPARHSIASSTPLPAGTFLEAKPVLDRSRFKRRAGISPSPVTPSSGLKRGAVSGPNLGIGRAAKPDGDKIRKTLDDAKVKRQKVEAVEEEREEDEGEGEEEEETALSVSQMFSSQFGKTEVDDYEEYDSG